MTTIGITANASNPRAAAALAHVCQEALRLGLKAAIDADSAALLPEPPCSVVASLPEFAGRVEVVVCLGGDGTLLQTVHALEGSGIPIMGLNIGSLGYLTGVDEAHFDDALQALRDKSFVVSPRTTLAAALLAADGSSRPLAFNALNDVVVSRGASARLVHLGLQLDDRPVTDYACDGVIVATATGSTAYSLAAGGPILLPETPALVVSVLSPHSLSARPLVIPVGQKITLRTLAAPTPLLLTLDGREFATLEVGDGVVIQRSPVVANIAFLPDNDPYAVMRHKLGWSGALAGRMRNNSSNGRQP